jgi:DNA-binding MarR family transcriptional regulator
MTTEDGASDKDPIELVAHEIAVLIRRAESARKGAQTLDRSAYLLLDAIAAHTPLALGALAERFQLDISTISRQVAMLEADGFVARAADPADGRVSLLAITGPGAAQLRATRAARHALFAELLADWSLEDRQGLGTALLRLNQAIARRDRSLRAVAGSTRTSQRA